MPTQPTPRANSAAPAHTPAKGYGVFRPDGGLMRVILCDQTTPDQVESLLGQAWHSDDDSPDRRCYTMLPDDAHTAHQKGYSVQQVAVVSPTLQAERDRFHAALKKISENAWPISDPLNVAGGDKRVMNERVEELRLVAVHALTNSAPSEAERLRKDHEEVRADCHDLREKLTSLRAVNAALVAIAEARFKALDATEDLDRNLLDFERAEREQIRAALKAAQLEGKA